MSKSRQIVPRQVEHLLHRVSHLNHLKPFIVSPRTMTNFVLILATVCLLSLALSASASGLTRDVFTNHFYVELEKDLPLHEVHSLAKRHGFVNLGPVSTSLSHTLTFVMSLRECVFCIYRVRRRVSVVWMMSLCPVDSILSDH